MITLKAEQEIWERLPVGAFIPMPVLHAAVVRAAEEYGVPAAAALGECKLGLLGTAEPCITVAHATEPKKYERLIITQTNSRRSARLVFYATGKSKYLNAMAERDHLRLNADGQWERGSTLTGSIIDGIRRNLNSGAARQQEQYYEELCDAVQHAVELVQTGAVGAADVGTVDAVAPASGAAMPASVGPVPSADALEAAVSTARDVAGGVVGRVRESVQRAVEESPAETPPEPPVSQPVPAPEPTTAPVQEKTVRARAACPACGKQMRAAVPNRVCRVQLTCPHCRHAFAMDVRPRA